MFKKKPQNEKTLLLLFKTKKLPSRPLRKQWYRAVTRAVSVTEIFGEIARWRAGLREKSAIGRRGEENPVRRTATSADEEWGGIHITFPVLASRSVPRKFPTRNHSRYRSSRQKNYIFPPNLSSGEFSVIAAKVIGSALVHAPRLK